MKSASGIAQDSAKPTTAQVTSSAATFTDAQRKFIRTAHAAFRVKDVYASSLAIEDLVAAQGGFVTSNDISAQTLSTQRRSRGDGKITELAEYTLHGQLQVRVPSEKTQAFLRALVGQMEFLDQRRFDASDAQFDLLRQQLAYQRAQDAQLDLAQAAQQGGKLDQRADVVGMRDQAKEARDEAAVTAKEFEDRIAFSTIDLSIYQQPMVRQSELVDVEAEFRNHGPGFGTRVASALTAGWHGLLDVVVVLMGLWPLGLFVVALVTLVRFLRRRKPNAPAEGG